MCRACIQICAHIRYPIAICRKRVGRTAEKNTKTVHTEHKLGSTRRTMALLAFPGKSSPNIPCNAVRTRNLSNLIFMVRAILVVDWTLEINYLPIYLPIYLIPIYLSSEARVRVQCVHHSATPPLPSPNAKLGFRLRRADTREI